jgi:type II secretory pathway predicted ATPase ExeA
MAQPIDGLLVSPREMSWVDPCQSELLLPSRLEGLSAIQDDLKQTGGGAIFLLTGEAGVGKTWLWGRALSEFPGNLKPTVVEFSRSLRAVDFLRLAANGLGAEGGASLSSGRLQIQDVLADLEHRGLEAVLVAENVQEARPEVWSEILALTDRSYDRSGFRAIIMVGPPALLRALSRNRLEALRIRVERHVHLLAFDLEETERFLRGWLSEESLRAIDLERVYQETRGNPRQLARWIRQRLSPRHPDSSVPRTSGGRGGRLNGREGVREAPCEGFAAVGSAVGAPRGGELASASARESNLPPDSLASVSNTLLPTKTPLRFEDGLIEVGWSGDLELAHEASSEPESEPVGPDRTAAQGSCDEPVEDRYAALQAWNEWARNRGVGCLTENPDRDPSQDAIPNLSWEFAKAPPSGPEKSSTAFRAVRAEPLHEHAPSSQLFAHLRQSRSS